MGSKAKIADLQEEAAMLKYRADSLDNHLGNLTARVAEIESKLRALEGHADKHDDFGRRWMCSAETLAGHRPDGDGNAH